MRQITKAKRQLTKRGFGPWARVYRPAKGSERQCVQLAVLPWGALDSRAWGDADQLPSAELARVLTAYASRVLTPRGSTAVAGLELMTALRPPTRAVKDDTTDTWVSGPVLGSLTAAVGPAPPEAPDEHPVVHGLYSPAHGRTEAEVLDEEAFDWIRPTELLTDADCSRQFAVGVDVNTAFLAAANRLMVGLSGPEYVKAPRFDKAVPGSWLIDLSGIKLDPRLPSPFTPHGRRPEGPAWYATPTVAYAQELIDTLGLPVQLRPIVAYVRRETGPYLDPWYKHLAEAYKATMADLGVTADLDSAAFLDAMAGHKQTDPGMAAVLSAIKSTVKGGIGKLRERPQGTKYRPGERWPALERPTWRPDIRAAVISAARVNMHRKLVKTALATQAGPAGRLAGVRRGRAAADRAAVGLRGLPGRRAVAAGRLALRARREAGAGHVPARSLARHGQARGDACDARRGVCWCIAGLLAWCVVGWLREAGCRIRAGSSGCELGLCPAR